MARRMIETALDALPYGPDEPDLSRVKKVPMPEGVSKRRLTRDVFMLSWPSLMELILSQLTSFVDQIMVGRIPGDMGVVGLAAVGLSMQPKFVMVTAMTALNMGATAVIARSRGQQNQERANRVFHHAVLLNFILAVVLSVVGVWGSEWMIRFMGTNISETTIMAATEYLRIQFYGLVPMCMTFTITAALRGVGDTRTPLIYNTVANMVNLVGNYILIYGKLGMPALGVTGASIATVFGQTVAFVIAFVFILRRKSYLYFNFKEKFTFDRTILSNMARVGIPAMVEQLLMRVGVLIYSRTVSSLGDVKYATHQVLMSIQSFSWMLGQAFSAASTTLVGQSLGKRRYDMAVIFLNRTRALARWISLALALVIILLRSPIVGLFTTDEAVIAMGAEIMFLIALSLPFQTDTFVTSGGLRGAGDTRYSAMVTLITVVIVRTILVTLMISVWNWGLWGAWISLMIDLLARTLLVHLRYRSGVWKGIKLKEAGENRIK